MYRSEHAFQKRYFGFPQTRWSVTRTHGAICFPSKLATSLWIAAPVDGEPAAAKAGKDDVGEGTEFTLRRYLKPLSCSVCQGKTALFWCSLACAASLQVNVPTHVAKVHAAYYVSIKVCSLSPEIGCHQVRHSNLPGVAGG